MWALRAAGPQRGGASAIPGGCTQNTLKSFEGSIEVVENRFINLLVVVREVTLAAPAAEVGEGGHSPPLFGRRGRRIPLPSALTESPGVV